VLVFVVVLVVTLMYDSGQCCCRQVFMTRLWAVSSVMLTHDTVNQVTFHLAMHLARYGHWRPGWFFSTSVVSILLLYTMTHISLFAMQYSTTNAIIALKIDIRGFTISAVWCVCFT